MNHNAVIAALIIKGIITEDEGQALVDFLHDKPQSTILADTINDIKEIIKPMTFQPLTGGPEQQREELAARERAAEEQRKADEEAAAAEAEATDEDADSTEETDTVPAEKKSAKK